MEPKIITITCLGCECGCEVQVVKKDGAIICLGGNNCPTGEIFALNQYQINKENYE